MTNNFSKLLLFEYQNVICLFETYGSTLLVIRYAFWKLWTILTALSMLSFHACARDDAIARLAVGREHTRAVKTSRWISNNTPLCPSISWVFSSLRSPAKFFLPVAICQFSNAAFRIRFCWVISLFDAVKCCEIIFSHNSCKRNKVVIND